MSDAMALPESWKQGLLPAFDGRSTAALRGFIARQKAEGRRVLPEESEIFRALELTPPGKVRVVILGQDPYHGEGQAHGLSFSVKPGMRTPPSLANIYKELKSDLGIEPARHGFLEHWAEQGVLLLNCVLTVELGQAGSHQAKGWEFLTDAVIRLIAGKPEPVVFMLWGSQAQKKAALVEAGAGSGRHLVLKAPHPSPLSAHRGFFGCRHFSQANAFLEMKGIDPIDWALPDR